MNVRRSTVPVLWFWSLALATIARADGPADDLFTLVPPEPGITLAVEDLRGQAREILGSPLFERLRNLPMVPSWMASDRFRKADRAARDVLATLGVTFDTLRDELLGDAVVLSLQPAPQEKPDQAKGLLLVKPRDSRLVDRLIKVVNDAQFQSGEQIGLQPRTRGAVVYWTRLFKADGHPPEFYVHFVDGIFAWSNSEATILGVIDRKASGGPSLGADPNFRKVRRGLPARPVASLFVNPRLLEGAMAEAPRRPDDRASAMLLRYLGAVRQVGFAIEWREGFALHSHESITLEKLDPWLKRWLTRPASTDVLTARVPESTVAVLALNVDPESAREAIRDLLPDDDRLSLENLRLVLQGILLGHDPLTAVLPRLGPGLLLSLQIEPDRALATRFPLVGVLGWSDPPGAEDLAAPLDNALRTAFAFFALDRKPRPAHLQVESRTIGDSRMTLLTDGLRTSLAYRVDRTRLVVGNSAEAVARFGTGRPPSTLLDLRARDFPQAETFAIVDLPPLVQEVRSIRGPLAIALANRSKRPVEAAGRDLDDLIAVADLFRAATFAAVGSKDATEVHRTIRLIAR